MTDTNQQVIAEVEEMLGLWGHDYQIAEHERRLVRDLLARLSAVLAENTELRKYVQHKPECAMNKPRLYSVAVEPRRSEVVLHRPMIPADRDQKEPA